MKITPASSDADYVAAYAEDWGTSGHRAARTTGREILLRERRAVAIAKAHGARTLLDVGCGEGYLGRCAREAGIEVTLMDVNAEAVEYAARNVFAVRSGPPVHVRTGLLESLEPAAGTWDAVTCCEVVEHVREPRAFVGRLFTLARRVVVLTTPVGRCYDDPLHLWHWDDERALIDGLGLAAFAGLAIERIESREGDGGQVFLVEARIA